MSAGVLGVPRDAKLLAPAGDLASCFDREATPLMRVLAAAARGPNATSV
jgi:hypothetical protein